MKLCNSAGAFFVLSLATALVNADGEGERVNIRRRANKNEKDKKDDGLEKFKHDHLLLDDANLLQQQVSVDGTFEANGKSYSLKNIQPFNIFSDNATVVENGIPKPLEDGTRRDRIFMSKGDNGESILVTKECELKDDSSDLIKAIDVLDRDGSETYMEAISGGKGGNILASIRQEDRDQKKLQGFLIEGTGEGDNVIPLDESIGGGYRRQLQQVCTSYKVIEVAIVYESTFCSNVAGGSSSQARSIVEATVARSSLMYESICVRVKISHLEGFCDPTQDPYRDGVNTGDVGCSGGFGLLQFFGNYWNQNRGNIRRDSAHIFYGPSFGGGVIGCARLNSLCDSGSYGANLMSFTNDIVFRSALFTHELGHNAGAHHVGQIAGKFAMEPSINSQSDGFTSQSRSSIQNFLSGRSCISTEFPTPRPLPGSSFRLENLRHQGTCMAVKGKGVNGSPVVLKPCDDTSPRQNWVWDATTHLIRSSFRNGKCLYPSNKTKNGSKLVLRKCNRSNQYGKWRRYQDKTLRPDKARGKCVDVKNDGTTLQLWKCNANKEEKWKVRGWGD